MKKLLMFCLSLAMLAGTSCGDNKDGGGNEPLPPFDGVAITDANFANELETYGFELVNGKVNLDSKKNRELFNTIKELNVESKEIASLNGISNFKALKRLGCSRNSLTSLDVSKNKALEYLAFGSNDITSIDLSNNVALCSLYCTSTKLTALDLSKNKSITEVDCSENQISELNVKELTELNSLACGNMNLTKIDVSANKKITWLNVSRNKIASLDVSANTALSTFNCSKNLLKTLDVTNNTLLTYISCDENELTSVDISKNKAEFEMIGCTRQRSESMTLKLTASQKVLWDAKAHLQPDVKTEVVQ